MDALFETLKAKIMQVDSRFLAAMEGLSDAQVATKPSRTAPSIGFHLWHAARWADVEQQLATGRTQIWSENRYVERWKLSGPLGAFDTGENLPEDTLAAVLPGGAAIAEYAKAAFGRYEEMLDRLTEARLTEQVRDSDGEMTTVQDFVLAHLVHMNRHLGMIEALKGVVGLRGTATE